MARERYLPRRLKNAPPQRRSAPSIYDASPEAQLRDAPSVGRRRRWVRPLGILAAAAAIVGGGFAYAAISEAAEANPNCSLIVPANPLSAAGLATPYQLVATDPNAGPCNESNPDQSAYVQGAIIDANGAITLYNPLVIDQGTQPAAPPATATVPAGATVALWFGFNGENLTLRSADGTNSLGQGMCVNGLNGSIFGQFSYCNAPAFFSAANAAIKAGKLKVPPLGTAKDGLPCPTVRDFSVVDQDQSDNVTTHYLANAKGQMAQPNATGRAAVGPNPADLANGSDNALLDLFMDPALGCTPWTAPEQSADGQMTSSLPLNELQAAAAQPAPVAIVPLNDPMVLDGDGNQSVAKTNLYRAGVDQPAVGTADNGDGAAYCQTLFTAPQGIQRIFKDQALFAAAPSVDPGAATNQFTFLAMRASGSFDELNCGTVAKMTNPITLTTNADGVVTAATYDTGGTGGGTGTSPAPSASVAPTTGTSASPSASVAPTVGTSPTTGTSASPSASVAPTTGTSPSVVPSPTATTKPPQCGRFHWWRHRRPHRVWWFW